MVRPTQCKSEERGRVPHKVVAVGEVVLAAVGEWWASEFEVHRTLAHHVVAHVRARLHDAVGERLVVCAREVALARSL